VSKQKIQVEAEFGTGHNGLNHLFFYFDWLVSLLQVFQDHNRIIMASLHWDDRAVMKRLGAPII